MMMVSVNDQSGHCSGFVAAGVVQAIRVYLDVVVEVALGGLAFVDGHRHLNELYTKTKTVKHCAMEFAFLRVVRPF
jgi:hypothetical protein